MATSNYLDLTEEINDSNKIVIDVSGYISGVVYIYGSEVTISFYCTNDGGEEEATVIGSPYTAINFDSCRLLDLTTNIYADSATSANGVFRFDKIGKYFKAEKGEGNVNSFIVQLFKII